MADYEVVWSGSLEKEMHDRQVRSAPELPQAHGSTGHVKLRRDGPRENEESVIVDLRTRWLASKE